MSKSTDETQTKAPRVPHARRRLIGALRALAAVADAGEFDNPVTIAALDDDTVRQQIARLASQVCGTAISPAAAITPVPDIDTQLKNFEL